VPDYVFILHFKPMSNTEVKFALHCRWPRTYPVGKNAVCRSVVLTIWHCNLSTELTKRRFCPVGKRYNLIYRIIKTWHTARGNIDVRFVSQLNHCKYQFGLIVIIIIKLFCAFIFNKPINQ